MKKSQIHDKYAKPLSITIQELQTTTRKNWLNTATISAKYENTNPTNKEIEMRRKQGEILSKIDNKCFKCGKGFNHKDNILYKNLKPYHRNCNERNMNMSYDSKQDTIEHKDAVGKNLMHFIGTLSARSVEHDKSKLKSPEKEILDKVTPILKELTYGSDEYKTQLKKMGTALTHHHENNSHHTEHYPNGIEGMDLLDLVEMFADWSAATFRHTDGDIYDSIRHNTKRYGLDNQLASILANTATRLNWGRRKDKTNDR